MGREKTRQRLAIRKAFAPKKKTAPTHKQHRFESFSQRVSRLKIDPIRRDRGRDDERDLEALESHFRIALDKWRDLNLSEDFTTFARKVDPLCDNLPQVLHHQGRIVESLLLSIEESTAVSAEPFLDLVAHLAQDLQAQFERYFEQTVTSVASVAARHQEVEVVEWCFNCLTWLFKYLERILATDIRPLYDLLAPYLGKERQKPFVSRFAAESLSFLVKRVGRRPEATAAFVKHALGDVERTAQEKDTELYEHSLTALFVEAIKSVKESLHSTGPTVFSALLNEVLLVHDREDATDSTVRLIRGVFLQLVHHASAQNLTPLLDNILATTNFLGSSINDKRLILTSQLLLLAVSVKNGERVAVWPGLLRQLASQIGLLTKAGPRDHKEAGIEILVALAVAHQKCPLDAALASLSTLDRLCTKEWQEFFPGFCNLYAEYGIDRFRSFMLPLLQKFMTNYWDGQTKPLSVLVPRLVRDGVVAPRTVRVTNDYRNDFSDLENTTSSSDSAAINAAEYDGLLSLLDSTSVPSDAARELNKTLYSALKNWLQIRQNSPIRAFVLGSCFLHLGSATKQATFMSLHELLPLLSSASSSLKDFPAFFQAMAALFKGYGNALDVDESPDLQRLRDVLIRCVSSQSHDLRLAALEVLNLMIPPENEEWRAEMASAIEIESTEPNLETARYISMKIRNLGMHYRSYSCQILAKAIPRWLFGLLHVKFAQVWDDACLALKDVSESKEGEEAICDIAFHWLNNSPLRDESFMPGHDKENVVPDDYFSKLRSKTIESISFAERVDEILLQQFEERHRQIPMLTSFNRSQALKVLKAVPHLAEKRSRQLVHMLLSWSGDIGADEVAEVLSDSDESSTLQNSFDEHVRWPRKDQKALLGLFATFNNPKVLYKGDEVYATLLSLVAHGDAGIQKSALQAILSWKDKTLKKYSDELFKFLDDARLREQLTVFLNGDGENALSIEDRPTVVPVVLRLVYGRIIARSRNERGSNRKAVFVILAKFNEAEINTFLDIILGPMKDNSPNVKNVPLKRQMGMLNMIKDLLETWKTTAAPFVWRLASPVYLCLLGGTDENIATSLMKSIRQVALQCLNLCFEAGEELNWSSNMPSLFERVIRPRLNKFAEENAQGVSSLLRMFGIWAKSSQLVRYLYEHEELLLPKVIECISLPFAKEHVKQFVINDIIRPLISHSEGDEAVEEIVRQSSRYLLEQIAILIPQIASRELTEDAVSTVTALIPYTTSCPISLPSVAARLVQQSTRKVLRHTKTELLRILSHFLPLLQENDETHEEVFSAVCASFAYFSDAKSRSLLVEIAQKFAERNEELQEVISLLDDINAFEPSRLDLPDFDRRSRAFSVINEQRWMELSTTQWRLLLGNLMFYIKDTEELAIRASASHALRRFVEASASKEGNEKREMAVMMQSLLSGIESGLKEQPELVQVEYLSILAEMARLPEHSNPVYDLRHLLMGGDEEASFFNNVLHVQQHRRIRTMNRLAGVAGEGLLSSRNVYRFLFPLLENFVFKSGDGVLAAEAMKTIGTLVEWLDWQQSKALVRKYIGFVKSKEDMQELVLKLLDAVTKGVYSSASLRELSRTDSQDCNGKDEAMDEAPPKTTKLSKTMPAGEKLSQYIIDEILPPLSIFLREKDESFVSRRMSVALIAAKFVQLLPQSEFQIRFPPLLTDVCNILRSKDQGSRDATRRALSSICALIGPSSFGFILRELRSALQRGFYLHVLAFSVHSILESTASNFEPGDLDYCVSDIMDVVIEDVFGNTGKEKDMKEYLADKQTKKEVKGKKSFDTMQLLGRVVSLGHLVQLVRPVQALLAGSLSSKEVRYVDELLRRIEIGVLQNESLKNRDILVFCYEIIQESHKIVPVGVKSDKKSFSGLVESAYLVRTPKKISGTALHASEASGKIIRFALEIVRSVLKKNKELLTPANISGFMPIIGDALLIPNEEVKLAAMRLFTGILNVPLPRIDEDAPVYIAEAAKVIEDSQSNGGEIEQASLKLISAVLRERKSAPVKVKAKTISILLRRLKGDLQIISQQGAAFNLLRSIINRQIIVPELYEIMDGNDGVAAISIRDHDRTTRDLARSVYFQFLMDCPQGKGRWAKQLAFLRGNLEYEHAEGRGSVMETVHLLLSKVGKDIVHDIVREVFWPLVSVMVNDVESECREMAARLVKEVFERANEEWMEIFLGLYQKLLTQGSAVQKRTAMQCWTLYLEVKEKEALGVDLTLKSVQAVLEPHEFDAEHWQLVYWALHTFTAITRLREEEAFAKDSRQTWDNVRRHLSFPHIWVKQEAASLIGMLLKHIAASGMQLHASLPLTGPGKIKLEADEVCELTRRHLRLFKDGVTKELASQAVRNLAFLGRVFASGEIMWQIDSNRDSLAVKEPEEDDSEDEFQGFSSDEKEDEGGFSEMEPKQTALCYLLTQLGAIIRREPGKVTTPSPRHADTLIPKTAALQLLAALCNALPEVTLKDSADTILAPLTLLSSPDLSVPAYSTTEFKATHDEMVRNATELQDTLRDKLGTMTFVQSLQRVKAAQRERREERRAKRKVDAVARPEIAARKKAKRTEREKEKRRTKNVMERGKRRGW